MAQLLSTSVDGFIASPTFASGFDGNGWKIWNWNKGKIKLECDDLVIRNTMTVFELLISKIRALKGALGITQANGKVKAVRVDETYYICEIEDDMSFVANDIIRCQKFIDNSVKSYWVKISKVSGDYIYIERTEFKSAMSKPAIGDELVQFGNTTNKNRQSAIYLQADESGYPSIDVLDGIKDKTFDGCVKLRMGCLDSITDSEFKEGLKGFGLYCQNGYFKGEIAGAGVYLLRADGSGYLANGNIKWDKEGNVSFSDKVALNWVEPISKANQQIDSLWKKTGDIDSNIGTINGSVTGLKDNLATINGNVIGLQDGLVTVNGKIGNKLTHISSEGIYTGTLAADNIVGGKIDSNLIDADSIITDSMFANKIKTVTIETEKLIAKKGSRIGNLTITDKGSLYGAVTTFDNCLAGSFGIITGITTPNESTYVNHVIDNIGSVSTYMLCVHNWQGTYYIDLPDYNDLKANAFEGINGGVGFTLRFIVPPKWQTMLPLMGDLGVRNNDAKFRIRAKGDSPIYNNNGGNESYIEMARGDVLELYCYIRTEVKFVSGGLFTYDFHTEYYIKSWRT